MIQVIGMWKNNEHHRAASVAERMSFRQSCA